MCTNKLGLHAVVLELGPPLCRRASLCTSQAWAAQVEDPESRGVEIAKLLHAGTWGLFHNESEPGRYPTFASINYNNETFSGEDKEMSNSPSRTPKIFPL